MMSLEEHYDALYYNSIKKVKSENFLTDNLIDSESDNRYGITLLIRPPDSVKNRIQTFLNNLKQIEPNQYYYRNSDIHITVMSIISCYSGFKLDQINLAEYYNVIVKSLENKNNFSINFKGITASESGVMIRGFMHNETLNEIRDNLRINFRSSDLEQSIDKRYSIQTAHSTVVRFRSGVKRKQDFLDTMEHYRNYEFGKFNVNTLELVGNDWYQRKEKVIKLKEFILTEST